MAEATKQKDYSLVKEIIFSSVLFISFILYYLVFSLSFSNFAAHLIVNFIALNFLVICFGLVTFLSQKWYVIFSSYFLSLVTMFVFFGFKLWYLVIILITLIIAIVAYFRLKAEQKARIKLAPYKVLKLGLPWVLLFFILLTTCVFHYRFASQFSNGKIEIPQSFFTSITPLIPNYQKGMTVNELVLKFTPQDLSNPTGLIVPEGMPESTGVPLDQIKNIDLIPDGHLTVDEYFYKVSNEQINKYTEDIKNYLPLIFSIGYFLYWEALSVFILYLAYLSIWIIFKILVALKLVKILTINKPVEEIDLS